MQNQIRIKKNFSIRDPKTGRHYTFVKGQIVKGKQLQFVTPTRIEEGKFVVEEIEPTEASIIRRREGRINWHAENGTDPQMDMELVALDAIARHFGAAALKQKGSGQTSIFSGVSAAYQAEFKDELTYEVSTGSDDPFAFRSKKAWRGVAWANNSGVALRCTKFIIGFVLDKY